MNRFILPFFFLYSFLFASGQLKPDTIRLYYAINAVQPEKEFSELDLFVKNSTAVFSGIEILGYADFLHHTQFNLDLSQRRADHVKDHLLALDAGLRNKIILTRGEGERFSKENGAAKGDPFWRRVDVIFHPIKNEIDVEEKAAVVNEKKIPKEKNETPSETREISEMKKGESIALEGLSFIPGRHMILPASLPVLEKLLETLQEHPELKIEIQGHVCCVDDRSTTADGYDYDTKNFKLSKNRAQAVHDYLVKNGIDRDRLKYKGFGHTQPKVKELTPADEQINRRVEIMILEN